MNKIITEIAHIVSAAGLWIKTNPQTAFTILVFVVGLILGSILF